MQKYTQELNIALEAARAAAKILKKRFGETVNARVKGDSKGLVTDTDLEADKAILQIIFKKTDYGVLSEESGVSGDESDLKWVIDPLDGTNNFARSLPLFAVSIGLMKGSESLVGVIIDPITEKEYYAVKGHGAFCNNERIKIPEFDTNYSSMLFLNHGYSETDRNKFKLMTQQLASSYNILKLGTTALELCHVATGSVDGFICSGDELWDFAAGVVIAQEAGYLFTGWDGNPWDGKSDRLLIARPEIHGELVKQIKGL